MTDIDDATIMRLICSADLPEAELRKVIAEYGGREVAEALLAEAGARTRLHDGPEEEIRLQFDITFGGQEFGYVATLHGDKCVFQPGRLTAPAAVIRQEFTDLLGELFGTAGPHGVTRENTVAEQPGPPGLVERGPAAVNPGQLVIALFHLVRALSRRPADLTELAVRFGSDKWGGHWYTPHYQRYLESNRERPVTVLEIGIDGYTLPDTGGASLRMWKHYFCRGMVYGMDLFDKSGVSEPRMRAVRGDQRVPEYLMAVVEKGVNTEQSAPSWLPRTQDALEWFARMNAQVKAKGAKR
jgi:hypothetical protein